MESAHQHLTDQRLTGVAERTVRRVKEGTSAVLLQSGPNESCGQILWNVFPICETSQTCCLMGKRLVKDVLGSHLKDLLFLLVQWLSITLSLRKTSQESINFGKKVLPGLFLGYALYAGGLWKGDVLIADLEELETMDASEIYSKRLNAKEVIFPQKGEFIFSNSRWTNQNPLEEIKTENICPDTAATKLRRGSC